MKMDRAERRRRTENKVKQREQLMSDLGMQQGTVYKRHREKLQGNILFVFIKKQWHKYFMFIPDT